MKQKLSLKRKNQKKQLFKSRVLKRPKKSSNKLPKSQNLKRKRLILLSSNKKMKMKMILKRLRLKLKRQL